MSITNEQLAELLAGIAKSQQAIIDAVERANGGWRNNHLSPLLTIAANMRSAEPRLLDLPSRVLMRYQGRAALDLAAIKADLDRLTSGVASPAAAAPAAPAAAAPAAPAAPAEAAGGDDMDFTAKS